MVRISTALITLALLVGAPGLARATDVLLVSDPQGVDDNIATALRADGHTVTVVTGDFANNNQGLRQDLSGYGLVVWIASASGYGEAHGDPTLFSHLEGYVSNGGRVLVTGYDVIASPNDPQLIAFLGGTGSRDVPAPPAPISMDANSLTTGAVDIRGMTPANPAGDRDALTGVQAGTVIVCASSNDPGQGQWTLRTLGQGEIAWVSNGNGNATPIANWIDRTPGPTGVFNAALRNFAQAARPSAPTPEPEPTPPVADPVLPDVPDPDAPEIAPPSPPLEFNANRRAGFGWTVSLHALGAHTVEEQRWLVGGSAAAGVTFDFDMDGADGGRYPALNGLLGDHFGLVARGHFFGRVDDGADAQCAAAVGGQVEALNALQGADVRIPSLFGLLSPELGAMFRSDRDASFYVAWHAPFAFLLEDWLSLELRASMFFLEDWRAVEGRETLFLVSAGLSIR